MIKLTEGVVQPLSGIDRCRGKTEVSCLRIDFLLVWSRMGWYAPGKCIRLEARRDWYVPGSMQQDDFGNIVYYGCV